MANVRRGLGFPNFQNRTIYYYFLIFLGLLSSFLDFWHLFYIKIAKVFVSFPYTNYRFIKPLHLKKLFF